MLHQRHCHSKCDILTKVTPINFADVNSHIGFRAIGDPTLVPTGVSTVINFTSVYAPLGSFVNNGFIVPKGQAGKYNISVNLNAEVFSPGTTGNMQVIKNGVPISSTALLTLGSSVSIVTAFDIQLAEGDFLQVTALQNSGGDAIYGGDGFSTFTGHRFD